MSSQPEAEWDDTEQQWMLALSEWREKHLCPMCGWPKVICQDPRNEGRFVADGYRCHVTTAQRRAQEAMARPSGGAEAALHQDAISWVVAPREDAVLNL